MVHVAVEVKGRVKVEVRSRSTSTEQHLRVLQQVRRDRAEQRHAGDFREATHEEVIDPVVRAVDQRLDEWKQQILAAGFPVDEAAVSDLKGILDRARTNRGFPY